MKTLFSILFAFISFAAVPQAQLVKDINTKPFQVIDLNDYTTFFTKSGNQVFFYAKNINGRELWKSDGTQAGTHLVKDINQGFKDGVSQYASDRLAFQNKLFFQGNDIASGAELWVSDGTESGTVLLKDINPGTLSSYPGIFFEFKNQIYFTANDVQHGVELWTTDGTTNNTKLFKDLTPGVAHSPIYGYAAGSNLLYFVTAREVSNSQVGQLWKSDGTEAGTTLIKEFSNIPLPLTVDNDIAYFSLEEGGVSKMWRSDGSIGGTYSIETKYAFSYMPFNGKILYASNGSFWITDGNVGSSQFLSASYVYAGAVYNGDFYAFSVNSLIRTNGTLPGTQTVAQLGAVTLSGELPIINDKMILPYNPLSNNHDTQELGVFDLTTQTVSLLKDINAGSDGSSPRSFTSLNGQVLFVANDGITGSEVWITDGTSTGTKLLADTRIGTGDSEAYNLTVLNNEVFFQATDGVSSYPNQLWKTGGDASTTSLVENFQDSNFLGRLANDLYYMEDRHLWKMNGIPGTKELLFDLSSLSSYTSITTPSTVSGGKMFYTLGIHDGSTPTGRELWVTDGTISGSHVVKDINPGPDDSQPLVGTDFNGKYLFPANDGVNGRELWMSDGTDAGTHMVKDINSGASDSNPTSVFTFGNYLFFSASDGSSGLELWKSDGTAAGTVLVKDINVGPGNSTPMGFTVMGTQLYFTASDGVHSLALWKTDGTGAGTTMVKSFTTGINLQSPTMSVLNGKIFFAANDASTGNELWFSDGTEAGTSVIDIVPGAGSSYPDNLYVINNILIFVANEKIWKSTGTKETISVISDIIPFEKFSNSNFVSIGNWLYFAGDSEKYGREIFKVNVKGFQTISFSAIASKTLGESPFSPIASSSSGLQISFLSPSDKISISGSQVQLLKAGKAKVIASQSGNIDFEQALPKEQEFCINPAKPTITLDISNSLQPTLSSSSDDGNQWYKDGIQSTDTGKKINVTPGASYKVKVTIDGCESVFSEAKTAIITGLPELGDLKVYPVPASNSINLSLPDFSGHAVISIYGMQGNSLFENKTTEREKVIDISNFASGIYLMKVGYNDRVRVLKVVKQ